jgi:hypothetical protein
MRPGSLSWPETGAAPVSAGTRGARCHAIGRGTGRIAEALAAGTGRRLASGAAAPFGPYDILIALADDLTDRHLDAVEATVGASMAGIIVGRDLNELAEKAAASVAALKAPIEEPPLRIEIVPALPIGLASGQGFVLAGRHADPAALRDLLAQGDSLVSLTGHGDGIDGDLGPLVLCPLDRAFLTDRTARPPTCRISGHCHRSDAGLTSQTHAERQLHPSRSGRAR